MRLSKIIKIIEDLSANNNRLMVGIAGPPASGKTTLAEKLVEQTKNSVLVPMDGFHLDNRQLDILNLRERKGSPDTFDAHGFLSLVTDIKNGDLPVKIHEFDRENDKVICRNKYVKPDHSLIVIEGNYLLFKPKPWQKFAPLFDYTIFLHPDIATVEKRLIDRWLRYGYDDIEARSKAASNDIPNAKLILSNSIGADLNLAHIEYDQIRDL